MEIKHNLVYIVVILLVYYILTLLLFVGTFFPKESRVLNKRLGTILFHSVNIQSDPTNYLVGHIYCYYPKKNAFLIKLEGEYFFKKVERIEDCHNWHGVMIRYEPIWMSEENMFVEFGT